MMLRLLSLCTCVLLTINLASAQSTPPQDAGRQIQLPDTLGANFSIADSASATGTLEDYDHFLGAWHFRFQNRRSDGGFTNAFTGHWQFEKKPTGRLIADMWRGDNPSQEFEQGTYTFRAFDATQKRWRMIGMTTEGNEWAMGLTWSDGQNRYAIQHYGPVIMRIRYFALDANRFSWRADRSTDGGKTWLRDAWVMEVTRVGR